MRYTCATARRDVPVSSRSPSARTQTDPTCVSRSATRCSNMPPRHAHSYRRRPSSAWVTSLPPRNPRPIRAPVLRCPGPLATKSPSSMVAKRAPAGHRAGSWEVPGPSSTMTTSSSPDVSRGLTASTSTSHTSTRRYPARAIAPRPRRVVCGGNVSWRTPVNLGHEIELRYINGN